VKETQLAPNSKNYSKLLRQISLFAGVSEPVLADLERASFRKKVEKGAPLFFRGDPADDFYLLLSGEIALVLTNPDGRELIINVMHSGDFFGELGLLIGQPRSADAVARRTADLVSIPRQAFLAALEREPSMARRLLEATASRLSRTSEFQNSLAFLDAQTRLARVLLDLESQNEDRGYITISQEELAQRSGLIRQTVAKTLGKWRRNGWLLTGRGHIMLLNRNALRLWFKERAG
jgi:CRP/FNR family transcriptional regulator, cyclic AMP receptor protein